MGLPVGMSLNVATGQMIYDGSTVQIQGTPSQETTQNITINAKGPDFDGTEVEVSKIYTVIITDPSSFPFRMDLTLSGYTTSSELADFPVLVEFKYYKVDFPTMDFWTQIATACARVVTYASCSSGRTCL